MKLIKILFVLSTVIMILSFAACKKETTITEPKASTADVTDYSTPQHWLSLPAVVKGVDVFYLYPTSWQKIDSSESNICTINNPIMLQYSKLALGRQASAFETVGNIFAPYYRQMDVASRKYMTTEEQERVVGGIPTGDAIAAFDYYIKHLNNGRPFILVGHSQGANILANLLSGYMKGNYEVYSRMIAAYVIGYSITGTYLAKYPFLKFAQGADDYGVIVSYNTEGPDVVPGTNAVTLPGGIAINPISWTRGEALAPASQNLGSIRINKDGSAVLDGGGNIVPVMNYADARVDLNKGVVICTTAKKIVYHRGTLHMFVEFTIASIFLFIILI